MDLAALPVPGVTHRQVDVGGLSVHVAEAGRPDAPPLVLLHGWPQHWYCWRRVVPLLAADFRLVMPDLRGHGWTQAQAPYDKEQLATDLLGLLDALELPRVGLVGHDWGGWTSFLACLRAPERFSGLLALGITHPFQEPSVARALQAWRLTYQVAAVHAGARRAGPAGDADRRRAGDPDGQRPPGRVHRAGPARLRRGLPGAGPGPGQRAALPDLPHEGEPGDRPRPLPRPAPDRARPGSSSATATRSRRGPCSRASRRTPTT